MFGLFFGVSISVVLTLFLSSGFYFVSAVCFSWLLTEALVAALVKLLRSGSVLSPACVLVSPPPQTHQRQLEEFGCLLRLLLSGLTYE